MRATTRRTSFTLAVLIALGIAAAPSAWAQWKWRDAAGRTQYSDLPPPAGTPERDILQRPPAAAGGGRRTTPVTGTNAAPANGPASAPPLVAARASDPDLEARRRQADQDAAEKKRAEDAKQAAARAENCGRAQEAKRTIDSGIRITRTNRQGEREYLDDAARAAEARRAQQTIDSDCR